MTRPLRHASRQLFFPSLIVLFAGTCSILCNAQAYNTASKGAEIDVFGGYLFLHPDDGTSNDNGGAAGMNYTRYFHLPVAPSFELRANSANGPIVNEKSYLVGARVYGDLHNRYHPYADFLIGKGTIHYNTGKDQYNSFGLRGDESAVYDYGGGIDIDVSRNFAAKLDVQGQRWRTGVATFYHPVGVLVGVTYRLPFRRYVSQRDLR